MKGLATGSIIILIVFVAWCAILLLLKCCGRKRVGCASGVPRDLPPRPAPPPPRDSGAAAYAVVGDEHDGGLGSFKDEAKAAQSPPAASPDDGEYDRALERYNRKIKRFERTILLTRVGFLIAGLFVIVGSILFYTKGIGSFIASLNDVQTSLTYSEEVLGESIVVTEVYINSSSALRDARQDFQEDVDTFCPALPLPPGDGLPNLRAELEAVLDEVAKMSGGLEKQAQGLRTDLIDIQSSVNTVNDALNYAYPFLYAAIALSVVLILITLALMGSVILAWNGKRSRNCFVRCMRNCIILPIFIIFMLLAWLFATLFLFAAVGGSDFCVSPNENTVAALELVQRSQVDAEDQAGNFIFELLKYYVSGCNEGLVSKPSNFEEEFNLLEAVVGVVHDFVQFLTTEEALTAIQLQCQSGNDAFGSLNRTAGLLHDRLHIVWGGLIAVWKILSCQTMNPLYAGVAEEAMCVNGINGLVWIFSTQMCIAVCCMIMITLRAAAKEIEEDAEAEYGEDDAVGRNILVPSGSGDVDKEAPHTMGGEEYEGGVEKAVETATEEGYEKDPYQS
uniref:Uncharacterized protein n=1 Tax=Pseudictyota dubia TaxID=2749911 RepID=A0A7R9VNU5_9STRA